MLRPIGNRILVKPEANDETTDSGIVLVEHRKPEVMGTVVAVGSCAHPLKAEADSMTYRLETIAHDAIDSELPLEDRNDVAEAAGFIQDLVRKEPQVKAGDLVLFSWTAGREVTLNDDERYLMMTEDDILAVIEP